MLDYIKLQNFQFASGGVEITLNLLIILSNNTIHINLFKILDIIGLIKYNICQGKYKPIGNVK